MIHLNCDLGERGYPHETDLGLLDYVDMVNIAVGGHAGTEQTALQYWEQAAHRKLDISLHLSYPDVANFGRVSLWDTINRWTLSQSLYRQRRVLPDVTKVKLHGALYNDAVKSPTIATYLKSLFDSMGIKQVVTMPTCELAKACLQGVPRIEVLREAFVDRRYQFDSMGWVELKPRHLEDSVIEDVEEIVQRTKFMEENQAVPIDGENITRTFFLDTYCIHSDNPQALTIAKRIRDAKI